MRHLSSFLGVWLCCLLFVAAASADPRDPHPIRLVPAEQPLPGGGTITPSLAVPQRYLCANAGTLRNVPDQYVMGWCLSGTPIDLQRAGTNGYQGWAYGNFDGCGWIYVTHIGSPQSGYNHSCTTSTPESAFMMFRNITPSGDGTPVTVKSGGCAAYLNTKPQSNGSVGLDQIASIASGSTVRWRYRTRQGSFVMVGGHPDYDWVFVPWACVPQPPASNLTGPS